MIRYFCVHPTAANLLMLAIIAFGVMNLPNLRRETFPDAPLDLVTVTTPYRGATAVVVADAICRRLENAVDAIANLKEIRCEAVQGRANVQIEMAPGGDIDNFLNDVKTEIETIDDFPDGVEKSVIKISGRNEFLAAIAVSGEMSAVDLKFYAEALKNKLQAIPEISDVTIEGFAERQIRIEIPLAALQRHGLNIDDIGAIVARQNLDRPLGDLRNSDKTYLLRLKEERRRPLELSKLIILSTDVGAQIRLGDIARIDERFANEDEKIIFDGRRAAVIKVFKGRNSDTLKAIDKVRDFIAGEKKIAAKNVTLALTQDVSTIVRDRLNMLIKNAWQGIALVALALWLFFGTRVAFWVAMGLPISFLGALGVMSLLGLSIDMITMVGLLISIGLLMDDAIVIAENIAAERQKGKSSLQAAIDGVRRVAPGVAASFTTTLSIFGALAFIKGDIGNTLKFVPIVLIITLSVSLIEAFLILPHHMSHAPNKPGGFIQRGVAKLLGWLTDYVVGPLADFAVRWRYLMLGLALASLPLSFALVASGELKFEAFPELEGDVVEVRILLPQGTPISRTETVVGDLVRALERVERELNQREPKDLRLVRHVAVNYGKNVDAFETGPHVATLTVDLLSVERRHSLVKDILAKWRAAAGLIPDVIALKFVAFQPNLAGRPMEFRLSGLAPAKLKRAAKSFVGELQKYDGLLDIVDDLRLGKPELHLRLRDGARAQGLDAKSLSDQLATAYLGKDVGDLQLGREAVVINLRLAALDRDSRGDLESFPIRLPNGEMVPLITVAEIAEARGWARLNRVNGEVALTITGEIDRARGNVQQIVALLQRDYLAQIEKQFPGLKVSVEGETKSGGETQASIGKAFLTGLIGVYLLLGFQFRSYLLPLVIIPIVPMALTGVIWGHYALGFSLSLPSILGFVALAGVAVNNAILIIEFTKNAVAEGMDIGQAAGRGSRLRFRAMFLSTLTTVLGLLPLLSETSMQAQILQPLVISLAFGLMATSVLVLIVIPALLAALHDMGFNFASETSGPGIDH